MAEITRQGTALENLRHVVEVFSGVYRESPERAPDDQVAIIATSDSESGVTTGLTFGDLRELLTEFDQLMEAGKIVVRAGDSHFEAARSAEQRAEAAEADMARLRGLLETVTVALEGLLHADISVAGYTEDRRLADARYWADKARDEARREIGQ